MVEKKPHCFGCIEIVFPKREDGHRKSPDKCLNDCTLNKECIVKAIDSDKNFSRQNEMIDNAYESGNINFLSRWSKKKSFEKDKNKNKGFLKKFGIFKRSYK